MAAKKVKDAPTKAPLNVAISRLTRQENESMIRLFRTAYCIVKHNFSIRSFPALISLQECNGLPFAIAYKNRMAASSFITSISSVIQSSVVESINSTDYFSILVDGSTDISVTEQEIVYVRMLKDGRPVSVLLGLMAVKSGAAINIAAELDVFLTGLGIQNWKAKLVGLGTDGASVNVGSQGGLGAILRREIPHLILGLN